MATSDRRTRTLRAPVVTNLLKLGGLAVVIHEEFLRAVPDNLLVGAGIVAIAGVQVVENMLTDFLTRAGKDEED
jgi:hypothetical protein